MRRSLSCLGAVIVLAGAASLAHAQYPGGYPCCPPPQAPDACGHGYYNTGPYGMAYGPNYWVTPPFLPFNGLLPNPGFQGNGGQAAPPAFPMHPYYRGPRDYFMYEEPR